MTGIWKYLQVKMEEENAEKEAWWAEYRAQLDTKIRYLISLIWDVNSICDRGLKNSKPPLMSEYFVLVLLKAPATR